MVKNNNKILQIALIFGSLTSSCFCMETEVKEVAAEFKALTLEDTRGRSKSAPSPETPERKEIVKPLSPQEQIYNAGKRGTIKGHKYAYRAKVQGV